MYYKSSYILTSYIYYIYIHEHTHINKLDITQYTNLHTYIDILHMYIHIPHITIYTDYMGPYKLQYLH